MTPRVSKQNRPPDETVLFVCEHGSAKSVVAAAHFNRIAARRGLAIRAISRGTDPDPANHPAAVAGLMADGLEPQAQPCRLHDSDFEAAASVVAFSPLPSHHAPRVPVQVWNVPAVSESYPVARDAIVARIDGLLDSFAQRS